MAAGVKHEIMTWDWKQQIDLEELNDAVETVFNGTDRPFIVRIDTQEDQYGIVVCEKQITEAEATKLYEAYEESLDDTDKEERNE